MITSSHTSVIRAGQTFPNLILFFSVALKNPCSQSIPSCLVSHSYVGFIFLSSSLFFEPMHQQRHRLHCQSVCSTIWSLNIQFKMCDFLKTFPCVIDLDRCLNTQVMDVPKKPKDRDAASIIFPKSSGSCTSTHSPSLTTICNAWAVWSDLFPQLLLLLKGASSRWVASRAPPVPASSSHPACSWLSLGRSCHQICCHVPLGPSDRGFVPTAELLGGIGWAWDSKALLCLLKALHSCWFRENLQVVSTVAQHSSVSSTAFLGSKLTFRDRKWGIKQMKMLAESAGLNVFVATGPVKKKSLSMLLSLYHI